MVDLAREIALRNYRRWHEAKATWDNRLGLLMVLVGLGAASVCFLGAIGLAVEGSFRMWFNVALLTVDVAGIIGVLCHLCWAWRVQRHEQPKL